MIKITIGKGHQVLRQAESRLKLWIIRMVDTAVERAAKVHSATLEVHQETMTSGQTAPALVHKESILHLSAPELPNKTPNLTLPPRSSQQETRKCKMKSMKDRDKTSCVNKLRRKKGSLSRCPRRTKTASLATRLLSQTHRGSPIYTR